MCAKTALAVRAFKGAEKSETQLLARTATRGHDHVDNAVVRAVERDQAWEYLVEGLLRSICPREPPTPPARLDAIGQKHRIAIPNDSATYNANYTNVARHMNSLYENELTAVRCQSVDSAQLPEIQVETEQLRGMR